MEDIIDWDGEPVDGLVQLHYQYWGESNRLYDEMNVLSILDKFTCDSLVTLEVLKDDNRLYVKTPTFEHMGVDKDCARCDVYIKMECAPDS